MLIENFNGVEFVNNLSNFTLNDTFYINGNVMSKDYIQNIRNNIKYSDVSSNMTLKYGIVVNRTVLKYYLILQIGLGVLMNGTGIKILQLLWK